MRVFIYSLKRTIYEGEADAVSLPTLDGEIGVLENHIPLVTVLTQGKVKIKKGSGFDAENTEFAVRGGFAQINPKETILLVS